VLFRSQGVQGTQGTTGTRGLRNGVAYTYTSLVTDQDPGNGNIHFNNATLSSVTFIYIDNLDSNGSSQTAWYDSFDDSTSVIKGQLVIQTSASTTNNSIIFNITGSVVVAAGYYKIPVTYVSGTVTTGGVVVDFRGTVD
jgi:hypothetical protein